MSRLDELWRGAEPSEQPGPPVNGSAVVTEGSPYAMAALKAEVERVRTAPEGTRNPTLNIAAFALGQLVSAGALREADVREELERAARAAGLDKSEIAATIKSGMGSGAKQPRIIPESSTGADYELSDRAVLDVPELDAGAEEAFWSSREILAHVWAWSRARRVSPWAALGCVLARIVVATEPHVVLPPLVGGPASLNLFVGLVGPSGSGKGAAEAVAAQCVDYGRIIATQTAGSGEGIAHGYMRRGAKGVLEQHETRVLFSVPEIDTLTALGNRQGATLMPELRRAWSGEALGFAYSDPAKRLRVPAHHYRLCLIAGIQPQRAGGLLEDADGGTPQRFLWLPSIDADAPDVAPPVPAETFKLPRVDYDGFATPSGLTELAVCDEARSIIDGARLARLRREENPLDGHALLAQLKTAAALALADGRGGVGSDDWALAATIMHKSAATRGGVQRALHDARRGADEARAMSEARRSVLVTEHVETTAVQRTVRNTVRRLEAAGESGILASELRKALTSRDRPYLADALEMLRQSGQATETETVGNNGRAGSRWVSVTSKAAS